MKKVILSGALAFALWGGAALANDGDQQVQNCPPAGDESSLGTGGSSMQGSDVSADVNCPSSLDQDTATGGSGQDESISNDEAFGGSGSSDVNSDIQSGQDQSMSGDAPYGGSDVQGQDQSMTQPQGSMQQPAEQDQTIVNVTPAPAPATAMNAEDQKVTKDEDMRGLQVTVGGGVEGYTGDLAPTINPGPSWGVGVALKPSKTLGVELGYSGAVNSFDNTAGAINQEGADADIVRNGGQAVATVGLSAAPVQPYLLGGIGIDRYNIRNEGEATNFRDDTVGNVPLGLGLRTQVSNFTADLRGTYGVLFNQGFAAGEGNTDLGDIGNETPTGRFGAQLRIGSTF